jgi:hypothetical protein
MSRIAPYVIGGLMLLGLAERQINSWSQTEQALDVPHVSLPKGTECLPRDTVLAALVARGETAVPEAAPSCATGPVQSDWYLVTAVGTPASHLAFDAAGCLVPDAGTACP